MTVFAWALLGALLLEALVLFPVLVGREAFYLRDILPFRLPYHLEFGEALRRGEWPLWTADIAGGMPLWHHPSAELADPSAVLFAWLPPHVANGAQLFLHMALATAGVAVLARSLRVHPLLCVLAGVLYVGSGPVASCWSVKFIPTSSLPWLVYAARRCADGRAQHAEAGVALATAFALLHPDPPALVGAALLALAVLWSVARRSARVGAFKRAAFGAVAGAMLCAPFLLPASFVVLGADRGGAVGKDALHLSWFWLLDTLAPGASGLPGASGVGAGVAALRDTETFFVAHAFVGMTSLVLMVAGTSRRSRVDRALAACTGVLTLLGLGGTLPLLEDLWPLLNARYPDKLLLPAALAWLLLAVRRGTHKLATRRTPVRAVALAGAGLVLLLIASSLAAHFTAPLLTVHAVAHAPARNGMEAALRFSGAVLLCAGLLFSMASLRPARRDVLLGALLLLGGWEAASSFSTLNLTTPVERVDRAFERVGLAPLAGQRIFSGDPHAAGPVSKLFLEPRVPDDMTITTLGGLANPSSGVVFGARYPVGVDFGRLEPARMHQLSESALVHLPTPLFLRVLKRLGVDRALIHQQEEAPLGDQGTVQHTVRLGPMGVWQDVMLRAAPDVEVVTRWSREDDLKRATLSLADPAAPGVVLPLAAPEAPATPEGAPRLTVDVHSPTLLRARVESMSPSVLVVRESFDEGFTATVDGNQAPIFAANVAQRGVVLPPGNHVVEMRYNLRGAAGGWTVCAAGCVALVMRRRLRRR